MGKSSRRSRSRERRRRDSSSSDSESQDEGERRLEKRLKEERKRKKEQKKLDKERMKQNETAEEKRKRRQEKKERKDEKRRDKGETSAIPAELAYTNLNNPFNDTKLTDTFVWGKKLESEGKSHLSTKQIQKETYKRVQKNLHEASEFKKIRDAKLAAREDMEMMKRDAELSAYGGGAGGDSKERQFNLDLVKERTRIRIEQGRAKAIDLLTRYSRYNNPENSEKDAEFELEDPILYIKSNCKSIDDFEDLLEDIVTYRELEANHDNDQFWSDIKIIVSDELTKREAQDHGDVHASVKQEVLQLFKDKSIDELEKLERQVLEKLGSNSGNKGYWKDLNEQLKVYVARKRLREYHGKMLRLKLARIREEQMREVQMAETSQQQQRRVVPKKEESDEEAQEEDDDQQNEKLSKKVRRKVDISELEDAELDDEQKEHKWRALTNEQLEEATVELYNVGCYSPAYSGFDDVMPGIEIIDAQTDVEILMEKREKNRKKPEGVKNDSDAKMIAIARKGMEGDEATFSVEEQLETQKHLWSDKYRPRKPTYLNRVQTGFDWNKYNQTHYDMDNPPPKIVQGYKFNIFYPDLLDPTKPPGFTVTPCDDQDFAVIRFKAGPPYEDIAFKVVNREWEILHKNGYKCQFQNGVFQLWFMFKKYRYRR